MPERDEHMTSGAARPRPQRNWATLAIIGLHVSLSMTLSFVMLLGRAPDETRHFAYVRWLAEHRTFPPADEAQSGGAHSLHPPLYYSLMVPLYVGFRGLGEEAAMRAMRTVAPLLGGIALWLLGPVVSRAAGGRRGLYLLTMALLATWPNLCLCVAMVNNDAAAVLMAAVLLHVILIRRFDSRLSSAAIWGAVLGLASLAKFSNFIAGAAAVAVALAVVHGPRFFAKETFWKAGFASVVCCLAVCGWWWYRNLLLYGAINPYPSVPTLPEGLSPLQAIVYGYAWPLVLRAIDGLWTSTWPVIDWIPDSLVPVAVQVLRVLSALAAAGAVVGGVRLRGKLGSVAVETLAAVLTPAAAYAGMLAALVWVATFGHMGTYRNGRYLMPFVVGLAIVLARTWWEVTPARLRGALGAGVVLFFLGLNVASWYHLITYWNPRVLGG